MLKVSKNWRKNVNKSVFKKISKLLFLFTLIVFVQQMDGRYLATAGEDGKIKVFEESKKARFLKHKGVFSILFSTHDPNKLFSVGSESIKIWNLVKPRGKEFEKEIYGRFCALSLSPFDKNLIAFGSKTEVKVWDLSKSECIKTFKHPSRVLSVLFSPHKPNILVSFSLKLGTRRDVGGIRVWDLSKEDEKKSRVMTLPCPAKFPNSLMFSPRNPNMLFVLVSKSIEIWDLSNMRQRKPIKSLYVGYGNSGLFSFSCDGKTIAVISGKTIKIWDVSDKDPEKWKEVRTLEGHKQNVTSVMFHPENPKRLYSGSGDLFSKYGEIKVWDLSKDEGKCIKTKRSHRGGVVSIAISLQKKLALEKPEKHREEKKYTDVKIITVE